MDNHEVDTSNMFFLLGGHDLEMLTIRDVLKTHGIAYADHDLSWDKAFLSSYREEMAILQREGRDIYGIELQEDTPMPARYHSIDHHNALAQSPSSLEQVMDILSLPMDRHQALVAANDKAYIPGMLQIGATDEEIAEIRKTDRAAQGVTEEDEKLADIAVTNNTKHIGELVVVHALSDRFSPICDRLFPYQRLLIHSDNTWMYSGQEARRVAKMYDDEKKGADIYRGGGPDGYVGLAHSSHSAEEMKGMAERIIKLMKPMYSYHIFYFPFKWEIDESKGGTSPKSEEKSFTKKVDLNQLPEEGNDCWERVSQTHPDDASTPRANDEQKELFNEKQYFFEFVHHLLYDEKDKQDANRSPLIRHYERKDIKDLKKKGKDVTYKIAIEGKEYVLSVDSLNLNLYSTGVGVLSFFLENNNYKKEEDILNINQFGRRIMPPNAHEIEQPGKSLAPTSITIEGEGLSREYSFRPEIWKLSDTWKPAPLITALIEDLCGKLKSSPIIDDRMLVNCWYGNNKLSGEASNGDGKDFINGDFWYKYVFVDDWRSETCQNKEMKQGLLNKSTYYRWQKLGTLYGVSPYSLVALTDEGDFSKGVLAVHMRTIYSRMFEMVLVQRASVLRFSGEIPEASKSDENQAEHIDSLYKEYIRFINQIYFTYVTAQDQGIELYEMMMKQNSLGEKVKELDNEISELYQYITLSMDREENRNSSVLNIVVCILALPTLIAGILGMNSLCEESGKGLSIWIEIVFVLVILIPLWFFRRKLLKWIYKQ